MPINTGEKNKMKNIYDKDIVSMGGSKEGIFVLLKTWKRTMPHDQQYRELQRNSIEAIQRVQKEDPDFKGKIRWQIDEPYLKAEKISKLSIVDNGDGMTSTVIMSNLNNLGASIRRNEHLNFGCGAKVAVLSKNHEGLIVKSWVKDADGGSMAIMTWSKGKVGMVVKAIGDSSRQTFPITWDEAPDFIKEAGHGTIITLLGNLDTEDTTSVSEDYARTGMLRSTRLSVSWLTAYLNTKFYSIPKNIQVSCQTFDATGRFYNILGHEKTIAKYTDKKESVRLTGAMAHIFYGNQELSKQFGIGHGGNVSLHLVKGQVAIISQGEVIKLDFDGSPAGNTLPRWGLTCLRHQVILIIEPDGSFEQNIERTQLNYNGQDSADFISNWCAEFKSRMPEWLRKKEQEKEQEQLKNNDYKSLLHKLAAFFQKDRHHESTEGDPIKEAAERKAASSANGENPNPSDNPNSDPIDRYGETKELFGVKIDKSKFRGKRVKQINEYPDCLEVHRGPTEYPLTFVPENYKIEVNVDALFFDKVTLFFCKSYKKTQPETVRSEVIKLVKVSAVQQVAFIYNQLTLTDEQRNTALGQIPLIGMSSNIGFLSEILKTKLERAFKSIDGGIKFLPEKTIANLNGSSLDSLK